MEKLTILNTSQFGTLTDSYKWCQYLKDFYDITFVCFDNKLKKMDIDGINYKYVHRFDNSILRGLWYIIYSTIFCLKHKAPVFIVYFEHCDILPRLLPWRKFHVDIRTLAVTNNPEYNKIKDEKLKRSLKYFKSISYISDGVKKKINIHSNNQYILPLGADPLCFDQKKWQTLNLLYVGTLRHRDIIKTVEGVKLYIDQTGNNDITYDIIGEGDDYRLIADFVENNFLGNNVHLHGRIAYDELKPFFDKNNIGVSFIPLEECYQDQTPTKTFEYILSGLYCIATSSRANKDVVTPQNGILISDSSVAFCEALKKLETQRYTLQSDNIRNTLIDHYTWKAIVNSHIIPIINNM
ncbi:MAG: glycosyltransferase [Prevotella sp.]|nr:glycosyltransferase [Prevotella sp.]